jgi:hypothetical protein
MAVVQGEVLNLQRKRELGQLQRVCVGELEGVQMLFFAVLPITQNLSATILTLSANN